MEQKSPFNNTVEMLEEFQKREDLNPCPFCGQKTLYLKEGKDGGINCPTCLVRMPNECNDTEELISCWNERV